MGVISDAEVEAYQRDGAIVLRNVFSEEWLEKVEKGIANCRKNPGEKFSQIVKSPEGQGEYFNDKCQWQNIEELKDFALNSPAAEIAGRLMKSETATFYHDHVLVKDPGAYPITYWHQDQPYYPVDGLQNLSIWMPVDPVSKEVSLQFVKGSHAWNKWFHPKNFASRKNYDVKVEEYMKAREYHELPDIDASDEYEILQWEVNRGDCVVFHMLELHQAPGNIGDLPRRVLSTRWFGDDIVFARRPWDCHPDIIGGCQYGEHPHGNLFPQVWKRQ